MAQAAGKNGGKPLKLEYIYNSGFHIETENHQFLIDYYRGKFKLNPDKPCTFIVTHAHADHFDPMIFNLAREGDQYILSSDTAVPATDVIHIVEPGQTYTFGDIKLQTCGSTDAGLSVRVEVDRQSFIHGGDLNLWIWPEDTAEERAQMEQDFKAEVACLNSAGPVDVLMAVVDGRLGDLYLGGPSHFIATIQPKHFIPMHFRDDFTVLSDFVKHPTPGTQLHIPEGENHIFEIE